MILIVLGGSEEKHKRQEKCTGSKDSINLHKGEIKPAHGGIEEAEEKNNGDGDYRTAGALFMLLP